MENTIQVTLSKESIEKLMEVSNFDEKQRRIFSTCTDDVNVTRNKWYTLYISFSFWR